MRTLKRRLKISESDRTNLHTIRGFSVAIKMVSLCLFAFFSSFIFLSIIKFSMAADYLTPRQSMTDGETLVSSSQSFELGFFSPGNSNNRYLGIWYKNSPGTVVWVANRHTPITNKNGVLTLRKNGSLLLCNQENSSIWFSNSSKLPENPVAQILESGNLVVRDNSADYVWQSFDYPSDTLLPGMRMGRDSKTGFEKYLTAWKSADDPSPGDFSFRLHMNGLPELVIYTGSTTKEARTGPWNGHLWNGIPNGHNKVFIPMLVQNEDEFYFEYEPLNEKVKSRLLVDYEGGLKRFFWNETSTAWSMLYSWPADTCDRYAQCGANYNCRIDDTPNCACLKGYVTEAQAEWDSLQSRRCVKKQSDCPSGEGFLRLPSVKLPEIDWLNKSMNLEECKAQCTKNCSCRAYSYAEETGGQSSGCLMWFGDLIDIRECSEEYVRGQEIFIRVPLSDLASVKDSSTKKRLIIIVVVSIISGLFILGLLLYRIALSKKRNRGSLEGWKEVIEVPLYDLATVRAATNNFSKANLLGRGGFGFVYKGNLLTGQEIAVKRLSDKSGQGLKEFLNEVVLIGKLQHRNLVGLLGSCIEGKERMLIYEYMHNKSLDYFIFDPERSKLLSWKTRFAIIIGIARGLLYLHQDSKLQIVHRDLKASNILLDSNLHPKISDFGLARIFKDEDEEANTKRVAGTCGYMSPEYANDGTFSMKSDVFSLGVLLLEIVSGKMNRGFRHPTHYHNLLGHAWLLWNDGSAIELMDTFLKNTFIESQVIRCIHVGLLCVQTLPEDRPTMSTIVFMLANEGVALPQPNQPGFFTERGVIMCSVSNEHRSQSQNGLSITTEEGR